MVVCVLPPSPSPTGRMATPSLHSCEESSPILVSHCSVTWTKEMPVSCPSGIHPGQGLLPSHNITNSFLPPTFCFPLEPFYPFLFGRAPVQDRAHVCTNLEFKEIADAQKPRFFSLSPFPYSVGWTETCLDRLLPRTLQCFLPFVFE